MEVDLQSDSDSDFTVVFLDDSTKSVDSLISDEPHLFLNDLHSGMLS